MKGESNDWYKNNSPDGQVEGKFFGRHRDNLQDQKAGQVKMLGTKNTGDTEEQGHCTKRWLAYNWIENEL